MQLANAILYTVPLLCIASELLYVTNFANYATKTSFVFIYFGFLKIYFDFASTGFKPGLLKTFYEIAF
jgi:hypothetical protein